MADPNQNIRDGKKDLNEISAIVGALDDGFQSLTSRLTDLAEGLSNIVDDARAFSRVQKDTISTLNKLAKTNEKLIKNQIDLNNGQLSSKKINEQINEITATREVLNQRLNNLLAKQTQNLVLSLNELDEIKTLQEGIAEITGEVTDNYKNQLNFAKEIEKRAGGFQKLAGVVKSIPGLKGLAGPFQDAADSAAKAAASGKSTFQIFKAGAGGLMSFLKGPIWITALVTAAKFFLDAMFDADKRVTDIAKNFSISKDSARAQYEVLKSSKTVLTSILDSTKNITEAFNELASLSDFVYQASFKQLDTQIQLTKEIGIQAEEAIQLQQLFVLNNNESDKGLDIIYDQIAAFANQNKIVADGRKIIADVNRLSGLIKLNFRGNTGEIVKTVLEAKKLGLTLDQVAKTQSSLLDFESSISAQIEAELLTGRQINLERARLFALNNDIAGLTEEIANQNITAASFSRMNAIQQESIAKTLGMSANELGDTLYKQELINKAGGQELKNKRETIKLLESQGKLSEAARLQQELTALEGGLLRGEALEDAQKSLDAQTKFEASLERAKEIFSDLVDGGAIDKLSDFIIKFANALSSGQSLASILLRGPKSENKEERQNRQMSSLGVSQSEIKQIQKEEVITAGPGPKFAEGGIVRKPIYNATVGEAGPEAIIPLDKFDGFMKSQQETNMLLRQLVNKSTDITLNGERLTNGLAKQTYALGS
jgi:hypothetical protein